MNKYPKKLSPSFIGALRTFSYWIACGTPGINILKGIDYRSVMIEEPSLMEQAYAIFGNNIELDEEGNVLNAKYAELRAAQYIRSYCDESYTMEPELEDYESELHFPPPLKDPKDM